MKTKEEYIEALNQMEEVYYNFDNCISAMNKFKECVNLLTGLVNEHFEEKTETNYEHYKDEIIENYLNILSVVKGTPKECYKTNCNDCDFKINQKGCRQMVKEWLKKPFEKPVYKLTKFEIDLLQSCSQGYSPKYQFKNINSLTEMRKNGYFKGVNRDATIEEIIAKSEVVG